MGRKPQEDANTNAKRAMQKAVGKVIDDKKEEAIGTKEVEAEVATDLSESAREDTKKSGRQQQGTGRREAGTHAIKPDNSMPRISTGAQCVTQITVVETEPEKQPVALSVMTERARFMARQPGFISISMHRSLDGRRMVNYIQWQSREQLQAAHRSPEFRKEWRHFDELTDEIDPHLYEVVHVMETGAKI
jgi:heme-degrading monooxygenase HmoA